MILPSLPILRQPSGQAYVNWANPLAKGLLACICFNQYGVMDIVSGKLLTPIGGASFGPNHIGIASSTGVNAAWEMPFPYTPAEFSMMYWGTGVTGATNDGCVVAITHSSDSSIAPYVVGAIKQYSVASNILSGSHSLNNTNNSIIPAALALPNGQRERAFMRVRSGNQAFVQYVGNTRVDAFATVSGSLSYGSGSRLVVGEDYRLASRKSGRMVNIFPVWGRYLVDGELDDVMKNPWQLLAPSGNRLAWAEEIFVGASTRLSSRNSVPWATIGTWNTKAPSVITNANGTSVT